jgi:hypothetical protein
VAHFTTGHRLSTYIFLLSKWDMGSLFGGGGTRESAKCYRLGLIMLLLSEARGGRESSIERRAVVCRTAV